MKLLLHPDDVPRSLEEVERRFVQFQTKKRKYQREVIESSNTIMDWNDKYDVVGLTPNHWISPLDLTPVGWIGKAYKGGKMIYTGAKLARMGLSGFGKISMRAGADKIFKAVTGKIITKGGAKGIEQLSTDRNSSARTASRNSRNQDQKRKSPSVGSKSYQPTKKTGGGNMYTPKVEGRCRKGFYYDKRRKMCIRRKKR